MVSQVESFLCPDKQGTPEEGRRMQRPKPWVTTNNNKDEDNSPKNHARDFILHELEQICLYSGNCYCFYAVK